MQKRQLFFLFILGLVAAIIASIWIDSPGYMDAEYYYSTGLSLSRGIGFQEMFIWNYLNDPVGLPTPSHQYWMPATSILSSLSMSVFGSNFRVAQIPFLLLAALLAPVTAILSYKLSRNSQMALFSGTLAIFSGFFLPFLVTTDTFALYMLIGAGAFWCISEAIDRQSDWYWLGAGLFAGLAHLARVDGVLVLVIALPALWLGMKKKLKPLVSLVLGYLIIMVPWWLNNFDMTGAILSPGSSKVLWTLSYNELFSFPADKLAFQRWWQAGISVHIGDRWDAILQNLQSLVLVNGLVFLGPFMIIGAVRKRASILVRLSVTALGLLFVIMSIIFPFAGSRGGFFHSSSLVMPILWAITPVGLSEAIKFGARLRNWNFANASKVFTTASIVLALLTTIGLFAIRVIGPGKSQTIWSTSQLVYQAVDHWFDRLDDEDQRIAINNPPGFYVASGREAVVIPDGGTEELRQVVERYRVDWLVLDMNNPGLSALYQNPDLVPWLLFEESLEPISGSKIQIYRIILDE
jgi:4-amino-4-deoxy-L-arabinose transferase-like glycosyltransferase